MKLNWREPGVPASVVLHGAVLVAAIIQFGNPPPLPETQEAIPVEIIDATVPSEMMRGDRPAPPQPTPRVDRVDEKKEQNPAGQARRQVDAAEVPKKQEATAPEERKEQVAIATPPPPPLPRIVPPEPPKPVEPPKVAAPPKPAPAEKTEEQEEAEEVIRQAQKKREEQRKAEEARRAEERRKADEQKRIEEAQRRERERQEQARQQQAQAEQQKREREQLEAKLREDEKKAAEAKAAEDRRKAEEAKRAQEAARKAAEERRRREAEQEARNAATAEAARRALLASREAPQNSGNTGQQVSRAPNAGTQTATGQRLNPSDRGQLVGMIADQIRRCWNVPVSGKPSVLPQVRMILNEDGSLAAQPVLINASGDPLFRAVADSGMRAIRQCSPFRIPARFQPMYGDWKSTIVQLNPDD
ncbi:MAG: cell envelope integrity protein TolA [Beijerinckiaceae bacterium]